MKYVFMFMFSPVQVIHLYIILVMTKYFTGEDKESFESCNSRGRYITYRPLQKRIYIDVSSDVQSLKLASWTLVHYLNRGKFSSIGDKEYDS